MNNYNDLLRLARRLFTSDTLEAVHIAIDVSQARQAYLSGTDLGLCDGVGLVDL